MFDWLRVESASRSENQKQNTKMNWRTIWFLVKWKFDIFVCFKDLIKSKASNDRSNLMNLLTTQTHIGTLLLEHGHRNIEFVFLFHSSLNVNQTKVLFVECGWKSNCSAHSFIEIIFELKKKKKRKL